MDRRKNMLIGIVVGIVVVAVSIYVTGFTKQLLVRFAAPLNIKVQNLLLLRSWPTVIG